MPVLASGKIYRMTSLLFLKARVAPAGVICTVVIFHIGQRNESFNTLLNWRMYLETSL